MGMPPFMTDNAGFRISYNSTASIPVPHTGKLARPTASTATIKGHIMKRLISVFIVALSFVVPLHAALAASTVQAPEARARAFYSWFIAHDTDQSYPLNLPAIDQYVTAKTVSRLRDDYARSGPPGGVDYFLKVQDYDGKEWLEHIDARPAIMLGDVAVVPVTFGAKTKTGVLVFMRLVDGTWKITKIDDTDDYR